MVRRTLPVALAAALALGACSTKAPSVFFKAVCAPPTDATTCSFAAICDAQYIGETTLDLTVSNELFLAIETHNQVPDNASTDTGHVNTHDAFFRTLTITYDGGPGIPGVTIPVQGNVPANGTAVLGFKVIPADTGAITLGGAATSRVVARIVGKGVYADGYSEFETPELRLPITLCDGCIGPPACAAGTVAVACPGFGQAPASVACVTP